MNTRTIGRTGWLLVALLACVLSPVATLHAQGGDDLTPELQDLVDRAMADDVAADRIGTLLKPFKAERIEPVIQHWQERARATQGEIAQNIIESGTEGADKAALLSARSALDTEKALHLERMWQAMVAFREKGGDIAPYETWRDSVSGVEIDTSDVSGTAQVLKDWALKEDGGIKWAKNIAFALITLIIFKILAALAGGVTGAAMKRSRLKVSEGLRRFFLGLVKKLVMIIGVILALSMLGVDIGPFVAAIGVGGFVIGFALQDTLGNFAAGIMILMYRPFEIGHVVTAGGVTGKVEDITLVSTKFKTPDNQTIIVPNGSVWGGVIQNVTGEKTRRVDMVFGIGYDDDIAKAEKILTEIVENHPKTLADPAPVVKLAELADSSVNFNVRPWSSTADYWDVFFDVTRSVKERFDAEGISIPYPQRDVHLHQVESK